MNRAAVLAIAAALALTAAEGCAAAGVLPEGRNSRVDDLIDSLNAPSLGRAAAVDALYQELRGSNARDVHEALRAALSRRNILIVEGTAEVLAMLGDPDDLPELEATLATNAGMEVKCLVLRLLPAFSLGGSERARLGYIRHAAGYEPFANPSLLAILRRPPLDRRGRLLYQLEHLRSQIERAIVLQFDPIGAALRYIGDRRRHREAMATVTHYVGGSLGNDPSLWARVWEARGRSMETAMPDEMREIRMAALQSLADLGAEGTPGTLAALSRLLGKEDGVMRQAVFDALAAMCSAAYTAYPALAGMSEYDIEETTRIWRSRFLASSATLTVFAGENAARALSREEKTALFASAAACLGTALSFPADLPDRDGAVARMADAGLSKLETLLTAPVMSRECRVAVLRALGECGGARATTAIAGLLNSPYASPDTAADGLRLAEAAVDSLRAVAVGDRNGGGLEAREILLALLSDKRVYPAQHPEKPATGLAHLVLWRLQRLVKSTDTSLDADAWRIRLGW